MKPLVHFKRDSLISLIKDTDYEFSKGEDDPQIAIQKARELNILCKIYYQEENVPEMPNMTNTKRCTVTALKEVKVHSLGKIWNDDQAVKKEVELKKKIAQSKKLLIKLLKIDPSKGMISIDIIKSKLGGNKNFNFEQS
jgi:hypothetical protein